MNDRTCGQCQECCTVLPVETMRKDANVRCKHQCKSGCAIYGEHPQECKTYSCSWIDGYFRDKDRPDKTGMVFETVDIENPQRTWKQRLLICCNHPTKGKAKQFAGRYLKRHADPPLLITTDHGLTMIVSHSTDVASRIEHWIEHTQQHGVQANYADGRQLRVSSVGGRWFFPKVTLAGGVRHDCDIRLP